MRYLLSMLLAALLLPTIGLLAQAGDELFLPAYRPYANAVQAPATTPEPATAPTSTRTQVRPRLTAIPRVTAPPVAPSGRPRIALPKIARSGKPPVDPVPLEAAAPAPRPVHVPAPTVASTLSVVSDAPDFVDPASKSLLARLRKGGPEVPLGLPRGADPKPMIPPEPLEPTSSPPLTTRAPLDQIPTARPSGRNAFADSPSLTRTVSPFEPVRPKGCFCDVRHRTAALEIEVLLGVGRQQHDGGRGGDRGQRHRAPYQARLPHGPPHLRGGAEP